MSINIIPQQEIRTFDFTKDISVRVVVNETTKEEWFTIADICKALEIKNVSDASNTLDKDDLVTIEVIWCLMQMLLNPQSIVYP